MKKIIIACLVSGLTMTAFAQSTVNLIGTTGDVAVGASSVVTNTGYSTITVNHATNGGLINLKKNGTILSQYWADNAGVNLFANTGLSLSFFTDGNQKMVISPSGHVGIGYSNPTSRLEVAQPTGNGASGTFHLSGAQSWGHVLTLVTNSTTGDDARMLFSYRGGSKQWALGGLASTTAATARFSIWEDAGDGVYGTNGFGTERLTVLPGGNVGIGLSNPTNKLDVNGTIHSRAVKVDLNGWSDYVFAKSYKLPTLKFVETFIAQNKHLPDVPSAAEVVKDGLDVGEMNKLLMKKVEELTLYLIQQQKEIKDLEIKVNKIARHPKR